MSEEFIFHIDPDELPFRDDDDLGEGEPRIVEYMAKKIMEQSAVTVLNPFAFQKAAAIIQVLIDAANENCSDVECCCKFDPILQEDMFLTMVASLICFDEPTLNRVRQLDDGIIKSMDVSARIDGRAELNIAFRKVRILA